MAVVFNELSTLNSNPLSEAAEATSPILPMRVFFWLSARDNMLPFRLFAVSAKLLNLFWTSPIGRELLTAVRALSAPLLTVLNTLLTVLHSIGLTFGP